MGKKFVQHEDMCGCERCAAAWDSENPRPVFDMVEDPNTLDCGCSAWSGCNCYDYEDNGDD